jgi:hypothetical protein
VGKTLDVVRATQHEVLAPGEDFLVAAKVDRKSGFLGGIPIVEVVNYATREHPPMTTLPESMIWAGSNQRLLVWSADLVTKRKPKKLLGAFAYGSELHWIRAIPKRETRGAPAGKTYLDIGLRGTIVETAAKVADAEELARVIGSFIPPMPPGWGAPPR